MAPRLLARTTINSAILPMEAAPLLEISGVGKNYPSGQGQINILRDIELTIQSGEFISFIGHSGCGKSSLLNMIAGLTSISTGTMLFDGKPIEAPSPERAMVFQHYSLLPWLSVYQNVYEAVDSVQTELSKAERKALTDAVLTRVGLSNHVHKKPMQLSGGMRQRVAIARAFAVHPRMLLLDEPFGALDALTRGSLQEELLDLWSGDARTETVVMVTHDIDEAIYLSDRIVVFSDGPSATIKEIITVDLPRPRDKQSLMTSQTWNNLRTHLLLSLHC
ncbi:ABC transporter ATP-binding protein [Herpetosiphon giganteus]|uniref:ABC transporter ATP-binding protein n=1 Tax=Herpetosiphon giganteus TaxID=2029754 RepID=UPI00195BD0F0|nr:ABC transporter ATP-binding protein [Herpetosiphon giganteus]MBM7846504.1 nitrate ABC transporter ATP-binding subunit [Herpetosiphon giganteus]